MTPELKYLLETYAEDYIPEPPKKASKSKQYLLALISNSTYNKTWHAKKVISLQKSGHKRTVKKSHNIANKLCWIIILLGLLAALIVGF